MAGKKYAKRGKTSGWQDAKTVGKLAWKHKGTAVKALKLAKKVARMVNVEYKFLENNFVVNPDSGGSVTALCEIPEGDGESAREGKSVKPIRVSGRCYIDMNPTASTTLFRMIIFRGKHERANPFGPQGAGPYDILDDDAVAPLARKNHDNRFDTKILFDRLFTLSTSGTRSKVFDINVKLFGHLNFTSEQPNGTDIDDGGIYLLICSDQATLTPVFRSQLTLSYVDN